MKTKLSTTLTIARLLAVMLAAAVLPCNLWAQDQITKTYQFTGVEQTAGSETTAAILQAEEGNWQCEPSWSLETDNNGFYINVTPNTGTVTLRTVDTFSETIKQVKLNVTLKESADAGFGEAIFVVNDVTKTLREGGATDVEFEFADGWTPDGYVSITIPTGQTDVAFYLNSITIVYESAAGQNDDEDPDTTGYDLWIQGVRVTEKNQDDVLADGTEQRAASFLFNPENNTLIVSNANTGADIESQLPDGLTVYLVGNSQLGSISHTGEEAAPLIITTDGNYPGVLTLVTEDEERGVISGFSELIFEYNLALIEPDGISYQDMRLATPSVTIGTTIQPLVEETTITPSAEDFQTDNGLGEKEDIDLGNTVIDDILYTLNDDKSDPTSDGYDEDENCIVLNTVTQTSTVDQVIADELTPGTSAFAGQYTGLTFLVPAGTGQIIIESQTLEGNVLMVKVGENEPTAIQEPSRKKDAIDYNVAEPTYVYVYNGGTAAAPARDRIIRPGKKTVTHIKVYSVTISPTTVKAANPVMAASGGAYTGPVPEKGQAVDIEPTPTKVETVGAEMTKTTGKWFNLNGLQTDEPRKKGLYIHNGKKRYIK